ncbi:biotin transporter BioY [Notoacmeibacter ruber]|uniref:Biotin transporter n=1 Tax=Notoacmeibacter ruber TaxID=2670375 RepID=A0A3L7JGN0_9HYPH|nr:biotin transporter BioY [Notoacmeibacter ruber]RLQ89485.1 biotin transporter BioY [Notoacmeibacter ruber]
MTTRSLSFIALFAAFIAVLGLVPPIQIPVVPVPITAQTLGVMLAGAILGARRGFLAVLLFLVLVAIGLPLLPGGRGGLGAFAGPSAGFLFSWPIGAFVVGWMVERFWSRMNFFWMMMACVIGGIVAVYPLGILWLSYATDISVLTTTIGSASYIPGDLIKAVVASAIALMVRRSYPLIATRERSMS